jgi:hypothetical protein
MTILTIFLALFFTFASSIKILGWQKFIFAAQLAFFKKYGLNRVQMLLVGIVELIAAILLISSIYMSDDILNGVGSVMIAITSIGAIYFHLTYDTIKDAIPALITLTLASVLIFANSAFLQVVY